MRRRNVDKDLATFPREPVHCRNPHCRELLMGAVDMRLCPSCRWMGRWAFGLGALLAGALIKWLG